MSGTFLWYVTRYLHTCFRSLIGQPKTQKVHILPDFVMHLNICMRTEATVEMEIITTQYNLSRVGIFN